jgi:aryl-alcohol dehydrogenase-like predicted oxidoreductase
MRQSGVGDPECVEGSRVARHGLQPESTVNADKTHMSKQTSTLPTRALGATGMTITRVGFGAWAIGGGGWSFAWGSQDDDESLAAMRHAVERGVNWIDTAAVYGLGHSEELVGRLLRDYPASDRPYVFTKCGLVWDEQNRLKQALRIGEPSSLRREVEQSLTRLGVEQIDLYQMHWPAEDGTPVEVYWQTLLDLKKEGKVRAVGLSNHKVDRLEAAEQLGHVDTLQPPFSLIRRDALAAELPWCRAHGTGVIVYSPMQSGLLTGSFSEARAAALGTDDWRSRSPEFQSPRLENNLALADALRPIATRHGTTVGAIAVAWTLAVPGVTGAIVGARRPNQVDGWIAAGHLELTAADLEDMAEAIVRTGAGTGAMPDGLTSDV